MRAQREGANVNRKTRSGQVLGMFAWLALTSAAAVLGSWASAQAPDFYARLDRPAWAPPAGVFGPVWSVLYLLMGLAAWDVWRVAGWRAARAALVLYLLQLALNALWSWLFFQWHLGALAFAEIVLLNGFVLATTVAFWRVRCWAGALLVPYLAWVGFAAALSYALWKRNPQLLA
jgi:benzodiazapine receptor